MNSQSQRFALAIANAIIPIIGLFYSNWSFSFMLFYFFMDFVVFHGVSIAQVVTMSTPNTLSIFAKKYILQITISLLSVFLFWMLLKLESSPETILSHFWEFFYYKEMGFSQGYVLIPLLVFGGWQQYKLHFIKSGVFMQTTISLELFKYTITIIGVIFVLSFGLLNNWLETKETKFLNFQYVILIFVIARILFQILAFKPKKQA